MVNNEDKNAKPLAKDVIKQYSTKDLIVFWNPKLCAHPGYCWRELPQVFNPARRPWIDMHAASPEDIIKIIDICPTGALTYDLPEGSIVNPELARGPGWAHFKKGEPAITKIKVLKNGPLIIEGPSEIYDTEGKLIKKYHQFSLCRCGLSSNKPFCDGKHFQKGWKDE
jgi:uncharacterized Fe-S cluster protein YjdI